MKFLCPALKGQHRVWALAPCSTMHWPYSKTTGLAFWFTQMASSPYYLADTPHGSLSMSGARSLWVHHHLWEQICVCQKRGQAWKVPADQHLPAHCQAYNTLLEQSSVMMTPWPLPRLGSVPEKNIFRVCSREGSNRFRLCPATAAHLHQATQQAWTQIRMVYSAASALLLLNAPVWSKNGMNLLANTLC